MHPKSACALIYLIISLVLYWLGNKRTKKKVQEETQQWLPNEDVMDAIPLLVIWPCEEESISFPHEEDYTQESS